MKLFLKKLLLFASPFIVTALLVVAVDPFNYFNVSPLIGDSIKSNTSYRVNYVLWKLLEYQRNPAPNILLGDSRADNIDTGALERASGERFSNLAYGGGTLPEIIDTFWHVTEIRIPRNVYIGINFNLCNALNTMNRVPDSIAMLHNPLLYLVNSSTLKSLWYCTYASLFDPSYKFAVPKIDRDTFWAHQLGDVTRGFYTPYRYPDNYLKQLSDIAAYCRSNRIQLTFVLFPTHTDLQKKINEFGLDKQRNRVLFALRHLGTVIDMDYANSFTENRDNFADPYHYRKDAETLLVAELIGKSGKIARIFPAEQSSR